LQGYTGSGVLQGYTGSGVLQGYTGSGVLQGYTGSGVLQGYTGSGVLQGYTGSGVLQGYTGSGVLQGYTGSGVLQGYTGSGASERGYTGSGVLQGYTGSGVLGYASATERGYRSRVSCDAFGGGFRVAAMGPVETISPSGELTRLVILGQAFDIPTADSASLAVGDYVVAGASSEKGASIVYHVGSVYVAGISVVRLRGPVGAVDAARGTASVGAATVDYTALLSVGPHAVPEVDDSLVVAGMQPVSRGVVLARPSTDGPVGCSGP
jgi:hypothetical protein